MTAEQRYCRASIDDIKAHIARFTATCGAPVEWAARDRETSTLIVECATIAEAGLWSLAFCADLGHWREQDIADIGRHAASSFTAWFGWHVMIHASEPLPVQADLVLAAGAR